MAVSHTSGARTRTLGAELTATPDSSWAWWRSAPDAYTVGVEEETMLLDARTHQFAYRAEA
ncbi:MAG TPA: hypothetical protein VE571_12820, partial [Solirubrobacteraceae bacterium]|nr:hypothetical protein [Solirubrobacteraceae bacterium]